MRVSQRPLMNLNRESATPLAGQQRSPRTVPTQHPNPWRFAPVPMASKLLGSPGTDPRTDPTVSPWTEPEPAPTPRTECGSPIIAPVATGVSVGEKSTMHHSHRRCSAFDEGQKPKRTLKRGAAALLGPVIWFERSCLGASKGTSRT